MLNTHFHELLAGLVDGGVRVDVDIELTAPTLLFAYALHTANRAHLELGERIGATLDALGRASR